MPLESSGTAGEVALSDLLLGELGNDQIYRHAWREDTGMASFLAELAPEPSSTGRSSRQFDLGAIHTIREIRVHQPWGLNGFILSVSIDGGAWAELIRAPEVMWPSQEMFTWSGPGTAWARFVRVTPMRQGDWLGLNTAAVT